MDCIILALKVVFPILLYISIGYFLKRIKFYDKKTVVTLNGMVFKLFLPCLLFYNIYTSKIDKIFDVKFVIYCIISVTAVFILLMVFVPVFVSDNKRRGVIIQGIFRSNFVLFGLPVTASLLGEENCGLTSLLIAVVVPLFNVLAVFCLEFFCNGDANPFNILKGILKNPLIISSVLAVFFIIFKIKIPDIVLNVIRDLSRVATPLALISLGGYFTFSSIKSNIIPVLSVIFLKLIISPALAIGIGAYVFNFSGQAIVTLISMFATPTAVASFTMAQSMGGDSELAGQIVVFTSVLSVVTVFLIVSITKYLCLF